MSGLVYIVLECVKLAVPVAFKFSPVDARDMVLWVDVTKTIIISILLMMINACNTIPNTTNNVQVTQPQVVHIK